MVDYLHCEVLFLTVAIYMYILLMELHSILMIDCLITFLAHTKTVQEFPDPSFLHTSSTVEMGEYCMGGNFCGLLIFMTFEVHLVVMNSPPLHALASMEATCTCTCIIMVYMYPAHKT